MYDVTEVVSKERPLMLTPLFSFFDIEFADDAALIAKTSESMSALLKVSEREAAYMGLALNRDKTKELAVNTDQRVTFADGTLVPREVAVSYTHLTLPTICSV
eukprot:1058549-Alexandrium_andersonii.AAC.1